MVKLMCTIGHIMRAKLRLSSGCWCEEPPNPRCAPAGTGLVRMDQLGAEELAGASWDSLHEKEVAKTPQRDPPSPSPST